MTSDRNGPSDGLSIYPMSPHVTTVTSNVSNVTGTTPTSSSQHQSTNHNGVKYKRPTFLPIKTSPSLSIPTATPSTDLPGQSHVLEENRKLRYRIMQLEKRESQFTAALDKLQVCLRKNTKYLMYTWVRLGWIIPSEYNPKFRGTNLNLGGNKIRLS